MLVLQEFADALPMIEVVDIDQSPEHLAQHSQFVPVVEIDGRVRFRGMVNRMLLKRLIDARQRSLRIHSHTVWVLQERSRSEGQGG